MKETKIIAIIDHGIIIILGGIIIIQLMRLHLTFSGKFAR